MLDHNKDNTAATYDNILEIYQRCRSNGDWAKVYLETQGGVEFVTISVRTSAGQTAGARTGLERGPKPKYKRPSQLRRDRLRRADFLERRRQAAATQREEKDETRACAILTGMPEQFHEDSEEVTCDTTGIADHNSSEDDVDFTLAVDIAECPEEGVKNEMENVRLYDDQGAGESSPTETKITESKTLDSGEDENKLSKEDIEQLKTLFRESYLERNKNFDTKINSEPVDNGENEETDNIEGAKQWAMSQKKNFI